MPRLEHHHLQVSLAHSFPRGPLEEARSTAEVPPCWYLLDNVFLLTEFLLEILTNWIRFQTGTKPNVEGMTRFSETHLPGIARVN